MESSTENAEQLLTELKNIAGQAEELLRVHGANFAEQTKDLRDRLASVLELADETAGAVEAKATETVKAADKAIRTHPYQAIGVALGVGLVVGLLLQRK